MINLAYDIGPRIGIDGEQQFRQAIGDINTSMRTLGSEMKLVKSKFDDADNSMESLTEQNKVLNKQLVAQEEKLTLIQKALNASTEKYGENNSITKKWQEVLNNATADLNKMEKELHSNESAMKELGNSTEDTTKKTSNLKDAVSKLGPAIKTSLGAGAKMAVTSLKAVGVAATGAAVAAFKFASDASKAADDLNTMSAQTGLTTDQLQEMSYAARFIDVDLDTMTGSMAKLIKNMDAAKEGTGDAASAFEILGVKIKDDVTGELLNNKDVWKKAIDALGDVANETERDALAMAIFGKSAQDLNPLIKAGSDELSRLSEEAHKVGAVMSEDAIKSGQEFDDMMQGIEASAKGAALQLGVAVMPAISGLLGVLLTLIPGITNALKTGDWTGTTAQISTTLSTIISGIASVLPDLLPVAVTIITNLVTMLAAAVPTVLPLLTETALSLILMLAQLLIDQGPLLIQTGIDSLVTFVTGIWEALPKLIEVAITLILALVDSLVKNLPTLIPVAIKAIVTLVKGLIDALPELIKAAPKMINSLIYALIDNLPLLIDAAIELIIALTSALIQNVPLLLGAALEIMIALAAGLISAIPQLLAAIPKIFEATKTEISNIDWETIGTNIIEGIKEGVISSAKALASSVKDAASGALSSAKKFLGIQSPSKVFKEQVGAQIGAGMIQGIEQSSNQVSKAMKAVSNQMENDFNLELTNRNAYQNSNLSTTHETVLNVDGKTVAKVTSKRQASSNKGYSRSRGVPVY